MESLFISKTKSSPKIDFNAKSGVLEIIGRSIPENSSKFYEPIIEWIDLYKEVANQSTVMKVNLEYFNTGSSKYLYQIFKRFEDLHNDSSENIVNVEWYYEKNVDELAEAGEDYKDILNIPFEILPDN